MSSAKAIIVAGALIAAAVMFGLMSRSDALTHDARVYLSAGGSTAEGGFALWMVNPATKQVHLCVISAGGAGGCAPAFIHP